ncbi:MAG TPA: hypothetical protein VF658_10555 [Pyrinomonadaceae bacterium]
MRVTTDGSRAGGKSKQDETRLPSAASKQSVAGAHKAVRRVQVTASR